MIPEFNTVRGRSPRAHFHYRGKYEEPNGSDAE